MNPAISANTMAKSISYALSMLALASVGYATVPSNYPKFSWDTVPLFWHAANGSGPFSHEQLQYIGDRFPLVTIEKFMSSDVAPVGTGAEAKIVAAARQVKQASPSAKVMFYLNSIMDWDMYDLHKTMEAQPENWLKDDSGNYIMVRGMHVFDHSKSSCRELWLNVLKNASQSGVIDGAFLDRGNYYGSNIKNLSPARQHAWDQGHAMVETGAQEIFADGVVILNNANNPDVHGRMYERWGAKDYDGGDLLRDILDLQQQSTNFSYPHAAEAHGEPNEQDEHVFNSSLAAYLVGAGPYAYFACTPGWSVTSGWDHWYPQFDLPLGEPKGEAAARVQARVQCTAGSQYGNNDVHTVVLETATVADAAAVASLHKSSEPAAHSARAAPAGSVAFQQAVASACSSFRGSDQTIRGARVTSWETTLSRSFASGTRACLSVASGGPGPGQPCIHWSSGRVDGPAGCKCE